MNIRDIILFDNETIDRLYFEINDSKKGNNKRLEVLLHYSTEKLNSNILNLFMFGENPQKIYRLFTNSDNFIDDYVMSISRIEDFLKMPIEIKVRCVENVVNYCNRNHINLKDTIRYIKQNLTDYYSFEHLMKLDFKDKIYRMHNLIICSSMNYRKINERHARIINDNTEDFDFEVLKSDNPELTIFFCKYFDKRIDLSTEFIYSRIARTILFQEFDLKSILSYKHDEALGKFINVSNLKKESTATLYNESINVHAIGRDKAVREALKLLVEKIGDLSEEKIKTNYSEFLNLAYFHEKSAFFVRLLGEDREGNDVKFLGDYNGFLTETIFDFKPQVSIAYFWEFCKQNNCIQDMISGFLNSFQGNCVCNPGKMQNLVISVLQGKLEGVDIDGIRNLHDFKTPLAIFLSIKEKVDYILAKTTKCEEFFKELFEMCIEFYPENIYDIVRVLCLYSEGKNGFEINPDFSIVSSLENSFSCDEYVHLVEQSKVGKKAENNPVEVIEWIVEHMDNQDNAILIRRDIFNRQWIERLRVFNGEDEIRVREINQTEEITNLINQVD